MNKGHFAYYFSSTVDHTGIIGRFNIAYSDHVRVFTWAGDCDRFPLSLI